MIMLSPLIGRGRAIGVLRPELNQRVVPVDTDRAAHGSSGAIHWGRWRKRRIRAPGVNDERHLSGLSWLGQCRTHV
jgi:hypothetical protein